MGRLFEIHDTKLSNEVYEIFLDLGFEKMVIGERTVFKYKNLYCMVAIVEKLGMIIGYAHSLFEAEHYMYGDGDSYPLTMDKAQRLSEIRAEIVKAMEKE